MGRSASFASTTTHLPHAYCITLARDTSRRRPYLDGQPIPFNAVKRSQRARQQSTCIRSSDHGTAMRPSVTHALMMLQRCVGTWRTYSDEQPIAEGSGTSYNEGPMFAFQGSISLTESLCAAERSRARLARLIILDKQLPLCSSQSVRRPDAPNGPQNTRVGTS